MVEIGWPHEDIAVPPDEYVGKHRFDPGTGRHDYNDHFQEHLNPVEHCRAPMCKDTNWGGYGRLHSRGKDCPPYSRDPEPNGMAEFWESIREMARANGEAKNEARS